MTLKLAIPDYSFPKLGWEQALRLARDLGFGALDIGLFAGRSHLRPEHLLSHPAQAAAQLTTALSSHGLEVADLFGQPAESFEELAVNHPNPGERKKAVEFFWRFLELAARSNATHITLLPGVHFKEESYADSLSRCAQELAWRSEAAAKLSIALGVEPHLGSIISEPMLAQRLLEQTPGLSLTLDYGHFTCQGIADDAIEPLLAKASHLHARGGCKGKLQAAFHENTIDFARMATALEQNNYCGYVAVEYVWSEWMGCNQVDSLSETILLRDFLRSITPA